mmetsp:Transcript_50004/g.56630  ORF Transcript_50004/g.56630 Transcript_50004/m.56630 type:complete len:1000 (-) Transcript_50004:111-3110(-)
MSKKKSYDNGNKRNNESLIPVGILPSYLATAFGELYDNDGLAIFGSGLGWLSLMAAFVRFYGDTEEGHLSILQEEEKSSVGGVVTNKNPLVLVLSLHDGEHEALKTMLQSWGTPGEMMPTIITNESGKGKDRAQLYQRRGVFCVTSRILIVDLLDNTLSSKDVDGMLIGHADQVNNDSTEAFIIRIYTSQKRRDRCFIKAFTDSPEYLLSGFAKIDKTLKALQIRHLYLYPRFHVAIKNELEQNTPHIHELHQDLSPSMKEIQTAIVTAVQACMKELKKSTPFVEWVSDDLAIENCVTRAFDRAVTRQLEKDWHRLKPQTKQLVTDLRTLRTLFSSLIQYDCVTFWKLINSLKTTSAASRHPALWLLTPAANLLFRCAKERIYKIHHDKSTDNVPQQVGRLIPVLEENPKWRLLNKVLLEIEEIETKQQSQSDLRNQAPSTIMVVVKDERTVDVVKSYLVSGRDRTMTKRWYNYLVQYNDQRSIHNGKMSEESRLLLEEESRVRNILFGKKKNRKRKAQQTKNNTKSNGKERTRKLNELPDYLKKRRKIAVEKGRGRDMTSSNEDRERQAILEEAVEETEYDLEKFRKTAEEELVEEQNEEDGMYNNMFQASFIEEPRVIIKSLSSIDRTAVGMVLADLTPDYVVLYDFDCSFVRSLEVYAALNPMEKANRLQVYFLMFAASSEQKVFTKALEREQSAFERLIHHKKTMPPPVLQVEGTQEMQQALASGSVAGTYQNGTLPLSMDTRRGAGKARTEKRDVAVDVREFRSALPSILHRGGMRLAPVTLIVGDFILSNVHCVERKSISDLFGSLSNGRLYDQAVAMSKYYTCPCLLIEFDPAKSFCLQNSNELGMDIKTDSVCSKIVTLTNSFPKLRFLWSRSPYETLKLFKELKVNHDEVDVAKAIEVGKSESLDALLQIGKTDNGGDNDEEEEDEINEAGRDMLLQLPGVNMQIARKIMQECDSLSDLIAMNRNQLRALAGPVPGQKLFTFFHQDMGSL